MQTLQYTQETAQYAEVWVTWFPLLLKGVTWKNLCAEIHGKVMPKEFTLPDFALSIFVSGYLHFYEDPGGRRGWSSIKWLNWKHSEFKWSMMCVPRYEISNQYQMGSNLVLIW